MKKTHLYLFVILFSFLISCKENEKTDNEKNVSSDTTQVEAEEKVVEQSRVQPQTTQMKAQFKGVYLSTGGSGYLFKDENGKEFDFHADGNESVHAMFDGIDTTVGFDEQKHYGEWYNLTYKTTTIQKYDGGTGDYTDKDVLVLVSVEPAEGGNNVAPANSIDMETLKNAVFFGNQDIHWLLKFKNAGIEFTPNIGEEPQMMYYYKDISTCLTVVSPNEVKVKATFDMEVGYLSTLTIKRETCSDGESDEDYPYSIYIDWEDSESTGCGRDL